MEGLAVWLCRRARGALLTSCRSPAPTFAIAVLVGLYEEPERPSSAVDYVKKYMGASSGVDVEALRAENERLKAEVSSLQHQLAEAQRALANR